MKYFNQLDPQWAGATLGNTKYTIGRWGCLTTCLAMIGEEYTRPENLNPYQAAKLFSYTPDGNLLWGSIKKASMFLREMHRTWTPNAQKAVDEALAHPHRAAILHVNGVHFVLVIGKIPSRYRIVDPLGGKVKWNTGGYRITGARIIEWMV